MRQVLSLSLIALSAGCTTLPPPPEPTKEILDSITSTCEQRERELVGYKERVKKLESAFATNPSEEIRQELVFAQGHADEQEQLLISGCRQ